MTIKDFIKKRPYLVWYIEDLNNVSEEAIVEAVLNYGNFDDVQKMIDILKIKKVAEIFQKQTKRKRNNYNPKIKIILSSILKNMHKEVLNTNQIKLLSLIKLFSKNFGLVGGTAIALQIGHRRSIDFDLFANVEFDNFKIRKLIIKL